MMHISCARFVQSFLRSLISSSNIALLCIRLFDLQDFFLLLVCIIEAYCIKKFSMKLHYSWCCWLSNLWHTAWTFCNLKVYYALWETCQQRFKPPVNGVRIRTPLINFQPAESGVRTSLSFSHQGSRGRRRARLLERGVNAIRGPLTTTCRAPLWCRANGPTHVLYTDGHASYKGSFDSYFFFRKCFDQGCRRGGCGVFCLDADERVKNIKYSLPDALSF